MDSMLAATTAKAEKPSRQGYIEDFQGLLEQVGGSLNSVIVDVEM